MAVRKKIQGKMYAFALRPPISKSENGWLLEAGFLVKRFSFETQISLLQAVCKRKLDTNGVYEGKLLYSDCLFFPLKNQNQTIPEMSRTMNSTNE